MLGSLGCKAQVKCHFCPARVPLRSDSLAGIQDLMGTVDTSARVSYDFPCLRHSATQGGVSVAVRSWGKVLPREQMATLPTRITRRGQ